jgi:hypothetical protein
MYEHPKRSPAPLVDDHAAPEHDSVEAAPVERILPVHGVVEPATELRRFGPPVDDPLGGTAVSADIVQALRRRSGAGNPLPDNLAEPLGEHYGQDFSAVRVHADGEAGQIARSLQSAAFTHGNDVYFAPGGYQPTTDQGRQVIAHELGHVTAQRTGADAPTGAGLSVGRADDPAERAADRAADGAMAALRRSTATGDGGHPVTDETGGRDAVGWGALRRSPEPAVLRRKGGLLSKKKKEDDTASGGGTTVAKAAGHGLSREARDAFAKARPLNNDYDDFEEMTNAWVTQDQQKKIADVGGKSKGKADKRAVKDLLRAFLLGEYVSVIEDKLADPKTDADEWAEPTAEERKRIDSRYFPRTLQNRDLYAGLISKGPYAPETVTWLRAAGFDAVITKSDDELADEAEGPRIDVRATFIGGTILGMRQRMHLFIVYTSSEGKQTYFRGGPGDNGMTECDVGDYEPDTVDWDPSAPKVTLLKGDAARAKLDGLHEAASRINALQVPYSGHDFKLNKGGLGGLEAIVSGENCNSTAWTILDRAGVPKKKPSGLHPGWGHVLGDLKGEGAATLPAKESTAGGEAAVIKGPATNSVTVFADRAGTEKLGTLTGGTAVLRLAARARGKTQIKYGPANTLGWVADSQLGKPPRPHKAGRRFWVAGKANQMVDMFDMEGNRIYADGQNPIEVLDDSFTIGKGGMVEVRYSDQYVGEVEGRIDASKLTDVDPHAPKVVAPVIGGNGAKGGPPPKPGGPKPVVQPKVQQPEDAHQPQPLKAVTTNAIIPLFEQDGERHRFGAVMGGQVRTVTPTGETDNDLRGRKMVEFIVQDPNVRAWMPASDWRRLFGTEYPA